MVQESPLSTPAVAAPVPLSATTLLAPLPASLAIVSAPLAAPVAVGAKCTITVVDCPAFSVIGKPAPVIVNPEPVSVAELIVSAAVPDEVSVTACAVALLLTVTLPNDRLVVLTVIAGDPATGGAFNCREKFADAPPPVAVSVAVRAELTADAVAWKVAVVALAATVTVAGTVTDELLLDSVTASPPVGAAPSSVTVQVSVPAPVMLALLQLRLVTACIVGCAGEASV